VAELVFGEADGFTTAHFLFLNWSRNWSLNCGQTQSSDGMFSSDIPNDIKEMQFLVDAVKESFLEKDPSTYIGVA
jgi:hypothetical protein